MKDCEICPLLVGQTTKDRGVVLQTERWVVVLDKNQEYLGKAFVTLRDHKNTISDLNKADWLELHDVMKRVEHTMNLAFSPDVFNWSCLMNNAVVAGQPTRVHWHLHPRYLNGRTFAGEEFPDPKWPRRVEMLTNLVSDGVFTQITDAVRKNL